MKNIEIFRIMDTTYEDEIDELFEDVLMDTSVSFILKNQDLRML